MPDITYDYLIGRGHKNLDKSSLYAALSNFMNASDDNSVDATLRSYALQMTGVVFRKVGNITKAVEYGERALQEAKDSTSTSATSGAARDLAASLHIRGIISA